MKTKDIKTNYVTKDFLKQELVAFRAEIIKDVSFLIHESMENMKVYYDIQSKRHMTALMEGFKDEMKIYMDELISVRDRVEVLENR